MAGTSFPVLGGWHTSTQGLAVGSADDQSTHQQQQAATAAAAAAASNSSSDWDG
jgi:hypothetical protein